MIYINPNRIQLPVEWEQNAQRLAGELATKNIDQRSAFINSKRTDTWGNDAVLTAVRNVVGNKCWYSESDLTGADPNIDHFRPKGRVKEIDTETLTPTGKESDGYWWLAFNSQNFRLSSMHSNQRRVDKTTDGGKWDFFPIEGNRATPGTDVLLINEVVLPLDPCSATDVALMWFDPDGKPGFSTWKRKPTLYEEKRMRVTIWLFHLDKVELAVKRSNAMEEVRLALRNADAIYKLWQLRGGGPNEHEKNSLDRAIADIKIKISDEAVYAGAKRCAVQIAKAEFLWMDDYF